MMSDIRDASCSTDANANCVKCISWSAIFVGALIAVGLGFLLNVFAVAIGLSALPLDKSGMITIGIGGFLGVAIGGFAALFVAGWAAGYLGKSHTPRRNLGVLYGFTMWCVALLISVSFGAHLGKYSVSYATFISSPASVLSSNNFDQNKMSAPSSNAQAVSADNSSSAIVNLNNVGKIMWVVFVLFFIGAFASCLGGHCGMTCCRREGKCS